MSLVGEDAEAKRKKKRKGKKKGRGGKCKPACGGRTCGSDGWGGTCGKCGDGDLCDEGQCVAPNSYEFDRLWYHGLDNPGGTAVDHDDNVFVADGNGDRIVKYSSAGEILLEWGPHGDQVGEFNQPAGVAVSKDGQVYVADSKNHRIQKFSNTGQLLLSWGTVGPANGEFQNPNGIAVNPIDGTPYIVESGGNRVQWFADATHLQTWDLEQLGAFDTRSVTVDKDGKVYIVNTSGGLIHRISGNTIDQTIGSPGSGNGQLSGPWDAAVDVNGNIFVADRGNDRVQVFDSSGTFVTGWRTS